MKKQIWRYGSALILCVIGVILAFMGNIFGIGLIVGGIVTSLIATILALKQTEDRLKKLEDEIKFLKKN